MTTDQHIQFLRKMIAEMQSQIADLEAQQKAEFDARQLQLLGSKHGLVESQNAVYDLGA